MTAKNTETRGYTVEGNTGWRDETYGPTDGSSLWQKCPVVPSTIDPATAIIYRDDFFTYDNTATVGDYAEVSDAGTIATVDAVGGELNIATGATNNNESYVSSIHEIFKFADDKPLWFEARVKLAEQNTDTSNIIVGLSDTVGANTLQDDGAGPAASYDGAVFFKVDGGTVWQFETSNATTQNTDSSAGTFSDDTWTRLGFEFNPSDGTTGTVTPFIDGVAGTAQNITLSGLQEMHVLLGVKTGAGNAETLEVDYVQIVQVR